VLEIHFDLAGAPPFTSGDCNEGDKAGSAQLSQSRHTEHQVGVGGRQTSKKEATSFNAMRRKQTI
jgi:hypothetical protein